MNTAYKTIWNAAIGAWVAVSEATRARGKRCTGVRAGRALRFAGPLIAASGFAMTLPAWAACVLTGTTLDCTGVNGGYQGVANGGTINNHGSIATLGDGTWGIYVGADVTVNNYGAISGKSGIVGGAGLVVNNIGGTIIADERGIQSTNGAINLVNSQGGLIQGFGGALIYAGGTILNTGNSVIDGTGYFGLGFSSSSASITNTAGSTIRGAYSIYAQDTKITLDNAGLIQGNVLLTTNVENRITLRTGGQIQGGLSVGGAPGSTLTLAGSGTQLYSQAVTGGTDFGGTLFKEELGDWLLDRSFAPAGAFVNAGSLGFAAGGSFDGGTAVSLTAGTMLYTTAGAAPIIGHLDGAAGSTVSLAGGSSLDMRDNLDATIASDIGGAGALIHRGSGVLALSGNNGGFAGSILAYAGTLQLANQQALGDASLGIGGPVTLTSPTALTLGSVNLFAPAGQLSVSVPGSVTFNGLVSGTGTLDLRNIAGTVSLLGNNNYSGGTRLANNTVALGTNGALGQGVVSVEGATTLTNAATRSLANAFVIGNAGTLTVGGNAGIAITGEVSGDGGLVKVGADELVINRGNIYAGGTHVAQGTLRIANVAGSATGQGAVTVDGGATLVGTGSIAGPVSVAAGGSLSVGSGTGTMNTGALTLAAGSSLDMELGQAGVAGGSLNDLLNVNGDLSLRGTLNVSQSAGGNFGAGIYRLINYTGALTANAMSIGSAPTPPGYLALQTGIANQINLVNTGGFALNMWDGGDPANFNDGKIAGGNGIWRAGSPGDNWTDINGVANAGWVQNGFAVFGGAAGAVTVDNKGTDGAVRIGGAQFAVDGYSLGGDALTINAPATVVRVGDGTAASAGMTASINAAIGGTGGLVKDDSGTLVLGGANSYTGGTTVKGGTLQISADNNLGAAGTSLSLDGGTLRVAVGAPTVSSARAITLGAGGGTVDVANSQFDANGSIGGVGGLSVKGALGSMTLNAANTYGGGTTVQDGGVVVAHVDGAFGSGDVHLQTQNTRVVFDGTASAGSNNFILGRAGTADANNTLVFTQSASAGTARITSNGQGYQSLIGNTALFANASNAGSATIDVQGGGVLFNDQSSAGASAITNVGNGAVAFAGNSSAGTAKIGNLDGLLYFSGGADAATASVSNGAGATVDVSGIISPTGLAIGSLSGDGAVLLGATQLTLGGLNTNDLISGTVSDTGSLFPQPGAGVGGSIVKVGSGTLTLGGANTYTGGTTVASGTLAVNNAVGSATGTGAVQVQSGATLTGTGTIAGDVTLAKGGVVSAGNAGVAGGVGTLTTGNLSLANGSVLNYDLGQAGVAGGTLNDLINVNGNLQLDGTLNVAQTTGGKFGAGLYRLINYTGTLTDNGLDIGIAPTDAKNLQVQTSVAHQVNLVNSDGVALNLWDGASSANFNDGKIAGGSGTWRAGSPGDNWTDVGGVANGTWKQDGFAIFSGTPGTVTVDKTGTAGTVRIGGAQFAVDGYTVEGDALTLAAASTVVRVGDGTAASAGMTATLNAPLAGAGGLVKDDGGTLVLGSANSYTGGTTVKGGVLQISTDSNLGALGTGLALNGGTLRIAPGSAPFASSRALALGAGGGTVDLSNSQYGVGGPITGDGLLTVTGKGGTLGLVSANSYSGGTILKDGASITTTVSGVLGTGAVQQQGNATVLSLLGTASAGNNAYTVGRAASADSSNTLSFSQDATAGNATLTVNGTGWSTTGSNALQFGDNASAGAATIVNQGGAINVFDNASAGTATITNAGTGLLAFGLAASAGSATIVNQAGGLVRFADSATGAQASLANAAGGTLDVSGATAVGGTAVGSLSGAGAVVLGATRLTLGGLNTNDMLSGTVSDKGSVFVQPGTGTGGSLVKVGSGTLTLAGANSYTGGTTVAAGTLSVNNASGSATGTGAVQVLAGATLAGSGAIAGAVNIAKGGILAVGNSPGTLTLGGLSLAAGAVMNYELGQAGTVGGALNDLVNVNGNLQLDGTLNIAQSAGGTFGPGLYRLIGYTGTLTDNGLDIGTAPGAAADLQLQTSVAQQINLVNRAGLSLNFWDGGDSSKYNDGNVAGGSGTWRVGNPQPSLDGWSDVDGKLNANWAQDQFAVFGGNTGTVTVDGGGGTVRIAGAQFATGGYLVRGDAIELGNASTVVRVGDGTAAGAGMTATIDAALTGTGGLAKEDAGTLVLGAANTYSGGTSVTGGVLQIAADSNLGGASGTLLLDGGTLRVTGETASARSITLGKAGGGFDIDAARTVALTGTLSGSGSLRKAGAGTLQLGAANSYAGGTEVAAGSLEAMVSGALGAGPVSVADNASLAFADAADAGKLSINVAARGSAPTDNGGFVAFRDASSAGSANVTTNDGATVEFRDKSSAGNTVIDNRGGLTNFLFDASAGQAQITNHAKGQINLMNDASAGQARFVNESGGLIDFYDRASADQATVVNNAGARLRIVDLGTAGLSIGSLEGAGDVLLGAKALTLGGLGNNDTLSGSIGGAGGSIVKVGAGKLTLTGASSYTGGTTVNAGTLSVNNISGSATGSGAVLVQSGATLAGSGTVSGAVTIAKGGVLAAGNSPGTLTLGALTLAAGAALNYELGQAGVPGGALNDLIDVAGNLQLDGTLNVAQSAGGSFGPGLYRLMSYGGSLTNNGLDVGGVPAGTKLADLQVQTSVANQVNLVNRAGLSLNFWDGGDSSKYNDGQVAGGSGTWRAGNPQPSLDGWTDADGKLNANWAQDQFAVFAGKGGTVTVDGAGGAVRIAGAQFAVDGYVVQGDGITMNGASTVVRVGDGTAGGAGMTASLNVALAGTGGLSKEDAGRLILGGANTYSGGTTVKGGVLQGSATSLQGDIVNNAEVAFDQDKAAGTYAGTLSGTGRVRKIGTGTLELSGVNSYSGGTLVDAGVLATSVTGALGSGPVSVAADAGLQFGGAANAGTLVYTLASPGAGPASAGGSLQFAGTSTAAGAAIDNRGGSVRFQDSASAGTASIVNGARSVIAFADKASADKASVTIQTGAQLRIDQAATGVAIGSLRGAGDIVLGAKALTLGGLNGDAVLSGAISGAGGSLVKTGTGTLTLAGSATHSGETRVAMGALKAGAADAFSAASAGVVTGGATLDLVGFSQRMAGLSNAGTVSLLGSAPGTTLTLSGPYVGNDGVLRLGAKLDNPGIADRLVLDGPAASVSGRTTVQVSNLGGLGAPTIGAGIELISARNGATTTAQTTKDAFVLSGGHVDAGAFEYRLYAGDAGGRGEDWYLRADAPPSGSGAFGVPLPAYRAEASLFAALPSQLRQSDLGMLGNLRQRIGDDDVRGSAGVSPSAEGGNRRAWGRLISTDMNIRQGGTVSPRSEGRVTGLQAGTDLLATPDWRAGIYVGQLEGDTSVSGFASGLLDTAAGRNNLRSQYLGLYGTYTSEDGFYADMVLQAGRHRYTLQPQLSVGVSGKGNSLLASLEVGKAFALGSSGWSIEPQLQLIHRRQRLDDAQIAGALVQQDADSGWIGRAGVRVKGSFATGIGTLQPYGRVNVYRSSRGNDVSRFVNPAAITPIGTAIGGTSTELAAGFTLALSERTSIYGELGKLWASGGATRVGSSINAAMGVRVKW
ncbi:autotransporter-associated beta strand repeat-containing protein [Variovorax sp. J22G73]|uniref:autotransporter-associated beta strand repeat-containing protein n=1 Tax=unclassified Variovorax TaxID=663243 RepID=UPI0025780E5F|nr:MULTISPECIES: autotransporter-associated beta strand repeat-containing protein [unclassified Variovorax]MDM0010534.1 autotransporter-associated beta strand repeat-containing protein [Variovorax sp. J22R203]MDM0102883.1 autotransporter-associated beta strand repeat-containing protein [Variovorax sp. J22G73]